MPSKLVVVAGLGAFAAVLHHKREQADKVADITKHYGTLMVADARARARQLFDVSDYDRSIGMRSFGNKDDTKVVIYSRDPQARRLEHGFHGVDRLGRHVDQPARPHMRPAYARYAGKWRKAIEKALDD